jgi:ATP-dependent RNA helicase DeaD
MTDDPFTGIPAPLAAALARRGFEGLTPVQRAVLDHARVSDDLRISSETGSGKTVAIGLALAGKLIGEDPNDAPASRAGGPEALVITPTRELAAQVASELTWLFADVRGLCPALVTGGTDVGRERRALAQRPRLVVGTPGRILDHVRSRALDCAQIRAVVLDEADQMLDLGFKDDLDAIVDALPKPRRSLLVSATFPSQVLALAARFQENAVHLQGTVLGAANQDIEHIAHVVRGGQRYATLVNHLLLALGTRCLVFVRRRIDATDLAEMLAGDGFAALPLSGDLAQAQRTRTLEAFRSGVVKILVATDVAARGIDVADISTVVHFEPPEDPQIYTHRSGRTGRAGQKGQSVLLVPAPRERRVRMLLHAARIDVPFQPAPSAAQVKRALTKQTRRALHERLAAGEVPEAERVYAAKLLEDQDPTLLVATLLQMATPPLPREPFEIPREPIPSQEPSQDRGRPGGPRQRGGAYDRPRERPGAPARPGKAPGWRGKVAGPRPGGRPSRTKGPR